MAPSPIASLGTLIPLDLRFNNTSRQLCVDSRTPSSMARKCFSPRSFTPMIPGRTAWFVQPSSRCRHRRPRHKSSDHCPGVSRSNCHILATRSALVGTQCWPTDLLHPARQARPTQRPFLQWILPSSTAKAMPLPAFLFCGCTVAPVPTGTSPAHPSSIAPWES